MSNYIIVGGDLLNYDELQHWGIKGQKWGVRRYQKKDGTLTAAGRKRYAKEAYEKEVEEKRAEQKAKGDEHYNKSKYKKIMDEWESLPKDKYDEDYYEGWDDYDEDADPDYTTSQKHYHKARVLEKGYAKSQALGDALITTMLLSPIAGVVANKIAKHKQVSGKKRAAIVLGAMGATTVGMTVAGQVSARKQVKRVKNELGIKSVRERKKEMKRSGR